MDFLAYLIDFRIVIGAVAGAIIMFFVARKNPKWVEDTYQAQRAVSMQGTEEVDKLKKQLADVQLVQTIKDTVKSEVADAISKAIKG